LGPQAGDRSRRRQFAASLSVPAGAFGSSAGDPAGASPSRSDRMRPRPTNPDLRIQTYESRPANPDLRIAHHFSARPLWCLNLLSGGQTYPYLGHCITRGISLRRRANILRLGGVVRFWAAGVGCARGATSGTTKWAPTGIEARFAGQPPAIIGTNIQAIISASCLST
jgi:hypothetical protein